MADFYEDERGSIQDLFNGQPMPVTRIVTVAGAVRGNHVHQRTTQWTLVVSGRLLMAYGDGTKREIGPGGWATNYPGESHAWRALEDTDCLVFTDGPRSGQGYESDTYRLKEPLLS